MTGDPRVLTLTELVTGCLDPLLDGNVLAIRIPGFTDPAQALDIARRLAAHPSLSAYRNTPELVRVGESHYETHDVDGSTDRRALAKYLRNADPLMAQIRACCAPSPSPLDVLWRDLDASYGLERARIDGRPMFAGICRVFPEGTELLPHNDRLSRDAPGLPLGLELDAQLAANIYLQVPEQGGELQLWDLRPDEEQLAAWSAPGSEYGADRALAPQPSCVLSVTAGDLMLIDSTKLHAVSRQKRGARIGLSCFLGVRHGHPLVCWS
ncbi:2OG-Fe(II)-dependent halogenase WelO5 family protein [Streptomyces nodosus]